MEINNRIPFLYVLVSRKSGGTWIHHVHRNPSHIGRYFHATSHYHSVQKQAVLNTQPIDKRVSGKEHFKEEKTHLIEALEKNGYKRDSS